MRPSSRYKLLSLLCLNLLLAGTVQASLISNGGFDSNGNGWTGFPTATFNTEWIGTVGNPAGSHLINASGQSSLDPYVQQTVSGLVVGATYLLTWDLLHHFGGSSQPSFGVFLDPGAGPGPNGTPVFSFVYANQTGWFSQTSSFVATATSHTLRFAAELDLRTPGVSGGTDVSYYIDNVSLVLTESGGGGGEVPEPSTWLTIAGGSLALVVRRRYLLK